MLLFLLVMNVLCAPSSAAEDPRSDRADRVDIAARLVADGLYDRAAIVLSEIDEPRKADRGRFYTLQGLVALETGNPQAAVDALSTAIELDPDTVEPVTWVTLGAAYEQLDRPQDALDTVQRGEPAVLDLPAAWHLKSRALSALERPEDAYATALQGCQRFPSHQGLVEERFTQLIALGLTHEVALTAPDALWAAHAEENTWLKLTRGLLDAGAPIDAQILGEAVRLTFLDSPRPRVALATACMATESWRCAGTMLDEAAAFDAQYAVQAAESFRRAGDLARALYLNGRVNDPAEKARQRLGLLLELRAFAEASALDARLTRLGLVDEDQVAYALAYAHATVGNHARAETLITRLTDPSFVRLGTTLLESLEAP